MNQEIKLFAATKAFIVRQNRVLILRESGQYADGANIARYDVPGGRVQPGQHFRESLLREVYEEIGLTVDIGDPFFTNEWRPLIRGEQWQIIGTFFECTTDTDQVILSQDRDDYQWIDPRDYRNYSLIDNLQPAFRTYIRKHSIKIPQTLRFQPHLVDLVLRDEKNISWRVDDEKNISQGDIISLCRQDYSEFAKAQVVWVKLTTFGELSPEDKQGHESFSSDKEMYTTYSKYYNRQIVPQTEVKVIKFKLF